MKRIFILFLVLLAAGCARHTIIPDGKLAQIFHDAFLTNAYMTTHGKKADSLNIYEPIFARYGYTTADVQYTIGNFSKRKSARLGDVVEQAIAMLEREGNYYDREVGILDTIDNVARRTFTRTVYADTLIEVHRLADTSRLLITIEDLRPGDYEVSVDYRIDSADQNRGQRIAAWIEQRDSSRRGYVSTAMRRERNDNFTRKLTADTAARRLEIDLGSLREKNRSPKRPHVTYRNLRVSYTPALAEAIDSLYIKNLNIRIFSDEFLRHITPDSLALPVPEPDVR